MSTVVSFCGAVFSFKLFSTSTVVVLLYVKTGSSVFTGVRVTKVNVSLKDTETIMTTHFFSFNRCKLLIFLKIKVFFKLHYLLSSKHKTFVYHLYNDGPTSSTLDQHCINVIQMFCVFWVVMSVTLSLKTSK